MPSSWMLRRVTLVLTDVSEKHIASISKVTRIDELRKLAVTITTRCKEILCEFIVCPHIVFLRSVLRLLVIALPRSPSRVTPMMEAMHSSETSLYTTATRRNIPEDGIFCWSYLCRGTCTFYGCSWYLQSGTASQTRFRFKGRGCMQI
jgi:hypothetical protein